MTRDLGAGRQGPEVGFPFFVLGVHRGFVGVGGGYGGQGRDIGNGG